MEGLFPGYIFVSFDKARDRWQSINGTFGIRTLVGVSERGPSSVPSRIMETLLERCRDGVWHEDSEGLVPGQAVELVDGPFAGVNARFVEMLSGDRVRVMLSWLAAGQTVVMPSRYVMAIEN
jgi:transcriptional antiterminator RfaH